MVSFGGKELLKNSINNAKFHNKILEENEMWKQWEKECGLTMMVSDEDILRRSKKYHKCSKHIHEERDSQLTNDSKRKAKASSSTSDRWDHSGYHELYPDGHQTKESVAKPKKASRSDIDRWDHSGFRELYPDSGSDKKHSGSSKSYSSKPKRNYSKDSGSDAESSHGRNEKYKRNRRRRKKSSTSYKTKNKSCEKSRKKPQDTDSDSDSSSSDSSSSSSDLSRHIKEWRKSRQKAGY